MSIANPRTATQRFFVPARFRAGLVFFRDAVVFFAGADDLLAVELVRAVFFRPAAARPPFRPPRRIGSRFSGLP